MDTNNMDHGASERGGAGAAASEQCGEAAANEQGGEAAAGCCQGGITPLLFLRSYSKWTLGL